MAIFNQTCGKCGHQAARDAKFCPNCGERLGGGTRRCGVCGADNRSDARFCRQCGQNLDEAGAPEIQRHRWTRRAEEFAVRIEADDLPGLLKRGIKIEPGTNAMLIERGANRGMVPPGEYTISNLGQRIKDWFTGDIPERLTALLVDVSPTEMEFHLGGRFTSDPLPIGVSLRVQVRVDEPGKFLVNVLKGGERLTVEDLREYLYPEVVQLTDRWLRQHTLAELAEDPTQRSKFELALEEALRTTLAQTGLQILQVRTLELNLEPYDQIRGVRGKARLMDEKLAAEVLLAEAELRQEEQKLRAEGEKDLRLEEVRAEYDERKARLDLETKQNFAGIQKQIDLIELAEETRKVELEESRAELYQRMRQAVMSDKMDEVGSEAEFEAFLDDLDRQKLLREKERQDMLRIWKEEGEDRDKARAHLMAKMEVEHNYELRAAELKLRGELSEQALETELRLERRRAEEQEAIEQVRFESRLRRQEMEVEQRRRQRELDEITAREQRLQEALNQARIRREEIEVDRLEGELGILLLEKMKAVRRNDEHQRMLMELEKQERGIEMDLRRKEKEADIRIKESREQHAQTMEARRQDQDFELSRIERMQAFGKMGAVILADPEQARVIQQLSETEIMAGMSPEAIMARVSERSPDAAKAFAEMMRNQDADSKAEMEKLYERLYEQLQQQLRQQESFMKEQRESQREQARLQQEMYEKGLDTASQIARDVSQASQRDQSGPQVIVVPGAGGPQVVQPGGGVTGKPTPEGSKLCTNCGQFVAQESRHCEHCGHKFEGVS